MNITTDETYRKRLLAKIAKDGPNGCWRWTAHIGTWGYGGFSMHGKSINASRAAYLLLVGPIADGLSVLHKCDNPPCCNPDHLWLGTQAQNLNDCKEKGRDKKRTGPTHPRPFAKLTPELVREARRLYAKGVSQTFLARQWGVHSSTVSRAIRGEKWAHLK